MLMGERTYTVTAVLLLVLWTPGSRTSLGGGALTQSG